MITEYDFIAGYMGVHLSGLFLPVPVCADIFVGRPNNSGFTSIGYSLTIGSRIRGGMSKFFKCP